LFFVIRATVAVQVTAVFKPHFDCSVQCFNLLRPREPITLSLCCFQYGTSWSLHRGPVSFVKVYQAVAAIHDLWHISIHYLN